ncbi:hypothetical protein L914_02065 [Phytophthora nicotianae]|uniref:Uncharacterized protein n=2 Tax=Phytophthora nicotianae TaxID=4792 RepID=V9FVM1_PHYNI|nr:hypothetical protein F443_02178 [Phytophthora nicotianae P1569]ETM54628.1 hypothetical protein L914_02065 [Phytophthora nicotianae]
MARRNQNIDPSGRRHMASGNSYDYLMGADARAAGDQLSGEEDGDALDATCHFDGIRRIWRAADAIQILSLARRILQGRCYFGSPSHAAKGMVSMLASGPDHGFASWCALRHMH